MCTITEHDPAVVRQREQQKPQCMPLSYILPYFTESARRDHRDPKPKNVISVAPSPPTLASEHTKLTSQQPVTPVGEYFIAKGRQKSFVNSKKVNFLW